MAIGHAGSWFGLPDLGITEKLQDTAVYGMARLQGKDPGQAVSSLRTNQGGSNLWGASPVQSTSGGGISSQGAPMSQVNYSPVPQGQVRGASTTGGGRTTTTNPTNLLTQEVPQPGVDDQFNQYLNEYYNPAFARLGDLEAQYNSERPLAEQRVQTSYNEALIPLEERLASGTNLINTQSRDIATTEANAMNQARRAYNEMQQGIFQRFGGRSGPAAGMSEILGRQSLDVMGQNQQTAAKGQQQLQGEMRSLTDFVGRQKEVLGQKKQDALDQVKVDFDNKIREINAQKGQLESAKAQQRIDELIRARQRAYDIEDANSAFARQIDMFEREKSSQLAQQYSVNQGISSEAINAFKTLSPIIGYQNAANVVGLDMSQLRGTVSPDYAWVDLGNGTYYNTESGQTASANQIGSNASFLSGQQ